MSFLRFAYAAVFTAGAAIFIAWGTLAQHGGLTLLGIMFIVLVLWMIYADNE